MPTSSSLMFVCHQPIHLSGLNTKPLNKHSYVHRKTWTRFGVRRTSKNWIFKCRLFDVVDNEFRAIPAKEKNGALSRLRLSLHLTLHHRFDHLTPQLPRLHDQRAILRTHLSFPSVRQPPTPSRSANVDFLRFPYGRIPWLFKRAFVRQHCFTKSPGYSPSTRPNFHPY